MTPAPDKSEVGAVSPAQTGEDTEENRLLPASLADLPLFLASHLAPGKRPVMRGSSPLAFIRKDMIVLLSVQTMDARLASFNSLSNFQRLFDPAAQELSFSVEVFTAQQGKVAVQSIDAGRHRVCGSFAELPFRTVYPFGLSLVFPNTEGKNNFWIVFVDQQQYSVFTFYEQANVRAFIQDIDDNGLFDLLMFEDIFEESSGYETYITWHKWDGKNFVKHRSTNIVRRLRAFFESSRQLLLSRSWRRFFDYALLPHDAGKLQGQGAASAFRRIFQMQSTPGEEAIYEALFPENVSRSIISDVVFPHAVQNPFPLKKDGYDSFSFTMRISGDEESYFFSAVLALNNNPFSGRMFHFLPGD